MCYHFCSGLAKYMKSQQNARIYSTSQKLERKPWPHGKQQVDTEKIDYILRFLTVHDKLRS